MTYLVAALLGVIQGLTEFLPVSSTAHLLIAGRLLGFEDPGDVFKVMIQLGSILAIMWLYRRKITAVLTGLPSDPDARRFALVIIVGSVPALAAGALLSGYVKTVLYRNLGAIAAAFVLGGVVMLFVERFRPRPTVLDAEHIPVAKAFGVGLCQMLALLPGVSRSGATIVGGMVMGIDRAAAAELSFLLAMPIMIAAFAHDLLEIKDFLSPGRGIEIAIGFVTAFVASALVVRPFLAFIRRAGFAPFAWYRIALGLALWLAMYWGWGLGPEA